jgi:hypothetical protein
MGLGCGNVTVAAAGTRVALASVFTPADWLTLRAHATNGGVVYVGGPTTKNNAGGAKTYIGHPLEVVAGVGDWVSFRELGGAAYINLQDVYVDADSDGDKVAYLYGRK